MTDPSLERARFVVEQYLADTVLRKAYPEIGFNSEVAESMAVLVKAVTDWQPIETAPKDGSWILIAIRWGFGAPDEFRTGYWNPNSKGFFDGEYNLPTDADALWKPIDPPA